jgi:hypothetical protein
VGALGVDMLESELEEEFVERQGAGQAYFATAARPVCFERY